MQMGEHVMLCRVSVILLSSMGEEHASLEKQMTRALSGATQDLI